MDPNELAAALTALPDRTSITLEARIVQTVRVRDRFCATVNAFPLAIEGRMQLMRAGEGISIYMPPGTGSACTAHYICGPWENDGESVAAEVETGSRDCRITLAIYARE